MHFNANLMHLVTCHVVNNLTSSVVLGIDWLMEHRPEIDWPNYTVTLHLANGKWLLIPGLAAGNSKPTFVFCSSKVACKLVAKGEHAWLILFTWQFCSMFAWSKVCTGKPVISARVRWLAYYVGSLGASCWGIFWCIWTPWTTGIAGYWSLYWFNYAGKPALAMIVLHERGRTRCCQIYDSWLLTKGMDTS